ncbi:MAG: DNA cytosine methyltransferase [Methanobacteriaceae archaeon]
MKHKLITLFTGAGGLDWGFHNQGGYDLVLSNEILKPHLSTYTENNGINLVDLEKYNGETNVGICGDVHNLNIEHSSDVVIGGPPCQDFSVLRGKDKRAGVEVTRGKLYQQFLRLIKSSKPKVFVFENVPGMVSANNGIAYRTIQEDFEKEGYVLIYNNVLNASHIGAPQSRKRLIIIGIKKEYVKNTKELEQIAEKYLNNPLLVKYPLTPLEIFEGKTLESLQGEYESVIKRYEKSVSDIKNELSNKWEDEYSNLTFDVVKDYCNIMSIKHFNANEFKEAMEEHKKILKITGYYLKPINEQGFQDDSNRFPRSNRKVKERMHHIPPSYNFKIVENTDWAVKGLMSNIYRRLHPLKPSPTIIAYGGGGTGGYHYEYNRQVLTNRERARLQTFPDSYLFNGSSTEVRAQIGEAVPPILSYWIAKAVNKILDKID